MGSGAAGSGHPAPRRHVALRWMSRQPTMPPVIVASGCSDEKIQQQALQLGAKYFMIKPYHLDDMADNVRMLLSVRETDDGALDPESRHIFSVPEPICCA